MPSPKARVTARDVGLGLDAATTSKLGGHANPQASTRLISTPGSTTTAAFEVGVTGSGAKRAAPKPDLGPDTALSRRRPRQHAGPQSRMPFGLPAMGVTGSNRRPPAVSLRM